MSARLLNKNRLIKIISRLKNLKALVVGDIILDHYIWGQAERLSPEAPVPVVWAKRQQYLLGGSSNVAHNIVSLEAQAAVCGVIGKDSNSRIISSLLKKEKIPQDLVISDKTRPTTLKTRVVASQQQVVRVDWESFNPVSLEINKKLLSFINKNINKFDLVIIEDYGKGVINPPLLEELVGLCKKNNKIVTVDPKEEHIDYYRGVTALTPNLKEAEYACGIKAKRKEDIDRIGEAILAKLEPSALLITLGDKGMKLFLKDGKTFYLPTCALEVFDVSGAGDTVIAVFSLSLAAGASFQEAAALANFAAGIVVGKLGVAAVTASELKQRVADYFTKEA